MRGAHQAFFLDDYEKTRAVELLRRVEEFSGVIVLAYAIMSNHFHIFIYVPEPEEIADAELLSRINALYREASLAQVLGERRTTNGAASPRRSGATRRRDAAMPSCTATATGIDPRLPREVDA